MKLTARQLSIVKDITPDEVEAMHKGYDVILEETFLNVRTHKSNYDDALHVSFQIDVKLWREYKNGRQGLGALYGIDLSNYLSRKGLLNRYAVPSVDDKSNAKQGLKHIHVTYRFDGAR